ncbi:uncharacterized protein LOC115243643 [Formica exsecta]|uniref:uncharacterized protein LOC115243643 n=1 Tax=Formica exsecta TaxID=72781 RepID=UPI0011445EF2|nr:uncharacterized protein LOC115243643 [Formica exsecta]
MCVWTILNFYNLKILCIFTFVELCIMAFLILLVRKYHFLSYLESISNYMFISAIQFQRSRDEIKNVENVLSDVENKTLFCRDRYKSIIAGLKKDVHKTEVEMKMLMDHVSRLCFQREELTRNEILKVRIIQLMFGTID